MKAVKYSSDLFARLQALGIQTETVKHAPVFTVEEAQAVRGASEGGAHTKNLFLRDNKRSFFLVTLGEDTAVDLKRLRHLIGAKGGLSFASPDYLFDTLGVRPGSVSLFAAINDASGSVTVVIETALMQAARIHCHPLTNDKTTSIAPDDLMAFLRATGHEPLLIALSDADPLP
ncbi:prolyl-tRNA synthetase associated domain-containing protein [Lichenihabitans psoromatis]|uniref:prolyl-tRNA synthetase associated domain-containing protein n=1 Tax=Lichenihabitans psoromatis TaxID=2528642 RepID=UPI001478E2C8|nr:prolyl-tRNA synthetase associated domain-containing protein [Lichenihabitans psoromatis]